MTIRNIFKKISKVPKKYLVAVAIGLAIAVPVAVHAGYGPTRPVFDWNNPADRVGSVNGPAFNSFINTPYYGDERAFVDAKNSANTNSGGFADTVDVQPGQDYTIREYIHNNANQDLNASGKSVAHDVKARFKILPGQANGNEVTGYISADPSNIAPGFPSTVYDTTKLKNDSQAFELEYVPGSARIENNAHPYPGLALPDSITSDQGTQIGYDQMDGNWPGCFQYTAIVTIKVHVKAPALQLTKQVTTPGSTEWHKTLEANPGDTVSWLLNYKNTGTGVDNDITIRDAIPKGLTLVPGSITWFDVNHPTGQVLKDTDLSSGGVDVGNYSAGADGAIRFRTTVDKDDADKKLCEIQNVAYALANNVPEVTSGARVTIKNCVPPKPKPPVYSCDLLKAELTGGMNYKFTASATATNGAKITNYKFNFGDNTNVLLTDKNVVEHAYAKPGSYLASVEVTVVIKDAVVPVKSAACTFPITIGTTPPPVVPPATPPATLVNTGPGDVAAIFAATSVAGAMAYRVFISRRLSRQ